MFVIPWLRTAALIAVIVATNQTTLRSAERPNVLLICVDDLKPTLACYGDAHAQTPNMDRLASRGVLFGSAYCNQAVCSPSRNALMTSLRPQTLGVYDLPTHFRLAAPNALTIPQYFRQHGYRTEGMGKILHVGHGNHEDEASWSIPHWRPSGSAYALKESTSGLKTRPDGRKNGNATENADVDDDFYNDGKIAAEAVKRLAIAAAKPDEPFFMAVGFLKPHLPFVAPKKYWDKFDSSKLPMPAITVAPLNAPSYAPTASGELHGYADIPSRGEIDEATTRNLIHGYYAATSYTDAQIGRVLDALDANQLTERTVVVLWGDHGWHLGDHGMWCKHTNYEHAARIPLIVSGPSVQHGHKTSAMVESVDIFPTLCALAGVPTPSGLDGTSFASVLTGKSTQARDHVTHVYPRGDRLGRAIRNDRYRLVEWKVPGAVASSAEIELYDYFSDPLESKNVAQENASVVEQLRRVLSTYPEAKPQLKSDGKVAASGKKKGTQDRISMFKRRDKNQDGFLSREEFLEGQPDPTEAPKRFPKFDANQDGKLSEAEFVSSGKVEAN
jgi:iduronate 2-sulfatase